MVDSIDFIFLPFCHGVCAFAAVDFVQFKDPGSLIVSLGEGCRILCSNQLHDVLWQSCDVEVLEVLEVQVPDGVVVYAFTHGVGALGWILWNANNFPSGNHFA